MTIVPVVALLAAGVSLLAAAGLLRPTVADVVLALGPALLLGTAATATVAIALLTLGAPLVISFVAGVALTTLAGVALFVLRGYPIAAVGAERVPRVAVVAVIVLIVVGVVGAVGALGHPVGAWDAWSIYQRKAISLSHVGGLDPGFFENPRLEFMHADYPLLLPVAEAVEMKFGAAPNGSGLLVLPWLFFIAYVWTVVFVSVRVVRSAWAIVAGIAVLVVPGGYRQALSGNADIPMAALLGAGVLFAGCWLRTRQRPFLVYAAVLLAGAASAKNEGLLAAVVVLAAAALVARAPLRRRDPLVALAVVAVAVAPWRLWLARHGIHGDVAFGQGFDPGYLGDRLGRAWSAVRGLGGYAAGPDWPLILPAAIVLVGVAAPVHRMRPLALFHLWAGLGFFAALIWTYTVSHNEIAWYLGTSGSRTVTGLLVIATSAIVHLAGRDDRTAETAT